jgi:hypothetical protein
LGEIFFKVRGLLGIDWALDNWIIGQLDNWVISCWTIDYRLLAATAGCVIACQVKLKTKETQ